MVGTASGSQAPSICHLSLQSSSNGGQPVESGYAGFIAAIGLEAALPPQIGVRARGSCPDLPDRLKFRIDVLLACRLAPGKEYNQSEQKSWFPHRFSRSIHIRQ